MVAQIVLTVYQALGLGISFVAVMVSVILLFIKINSKKLNKEVFEIHEKQNEREFIRLNLDHDLLININKMVEIMYREFEKRKGLN